MRSDARKQAEEALEAHDEAVAGDEWSFAPVSLAVADALRALLAEQDGAGDAIDLASLPVHFIAHLPRGRVFMHPDTPTSGVRDPWPPPMPAIKDSLKTAFSLDGDGRDGFNGTGPFEG